MDKWGRPRTHKIDHPARLVELLEADTLPDLPPPSIRLSVRKEDGVWILATIKGEFRNEYTEETADDAMQLMNELITKHNCYMCGAPLWDVRGRVVCSRYWGHIQPEEVRAWYITGRTYYGKTAYQTGHQLPAIEPTRLPSVPTNHAKLVAWAKTHMWAETVKTIDELCRSITIVRYTMKKKKKRKPTIDLGKEWYERICAERLTNPSPIIEKKSTRRKQKSDKALDFKGFNVFQE